MERKNTLITAVGVIIFLAAGMLTMLFFPSNADRSEKRNEKNNEAREKIFSHDVPPAVKIPEPEKPKPDWYVYVTGEVKNPGYYKISADSRVFHAVEKAGGFTKKADQASVNMAEFLVDGLTINVNPAIKNKNVQQNMRAVKIPGVQAANINARAALPAAIAEKPKPVPGVSGLVDVNNATAKELEQLKGVGPAIAKRIVDYRNAHGKFSSPEDLIKIKGIGNAKLEKMRPQILIR